LREAWVRIGQNTPSRTSDLTCRNCLRRRARCRRGPIVSDLLMSFDHLRRFRRAAALLVAAARPRCRQLTVWTDAAAANSRSLVVLRLVDEAGDLPCA